MADGPSSEGDAQIFGAAIRCIPLIHADKTGQFDRPTGFLKRFAHRGIEQGLVPFQMPGRLIQHEFATNIFFHEQKAAVVGYDRGDGDARAPDGIGESGGTFEQSGQKKGREF